MPQKHATYITYGKDERCDEVRKFIEDAGVMLDIRDLKDNPLSVRELEHLCGHNPLSFFINPASSEFSRLGLDKQTPERVEMLELMSQHPGLLRRPIVKTIRLLTVGCNKDKIAEMLQINRNGEPDHELNGNKTNRITRRALPSKK